MNVGFLLGVFLITSVDGHGFLFEPPSRSSLTRHKEFENIIPLDTEDTEHNCGGKQYQIAQNYKCGLCGDPYGGPRQLEAGGKFARSVITRTYREGSIIKVTATIIVNHEGWFEYRICKNDDITKKFPRSCLRLLGDANGNSRFNIGSTKGQISHYIKLPEGLTCSQCVIQWRYHAGDDQDGCDGICEYQQEFYGCADVAIEPRQEMSGIKKKTIKKPCKHRKTKDHAKNPATNDQQNYGSNNPSSGANDQTYDTNDQTYGANDQNYGTNNQNYGTNNQYYDTNSQNSAYDNPSSSENNQNDGTNNQNSANTNPSSGTNNQNSASNNPKPQSQCKALGHPATDAWCESNCNHVPAYCPKNLCDCSPKTRSLTVTNEETAMKRLLVTKLRSILHGYLTDDGASKDESPPY